MVVGSVIEPRIIEAAIHLFGSRGFEGTNMRDLAKAARTTTGTVYRLFHAETGEKEKLYEVAINESVNRALKVVAEAVFVLVDNPDKADLLQSVSICLRTWFNRIGLPEAKLLWRVEVDDENEDYRGRVRKPLEKMITHVSRAVSEFRAGAKQDAERIAAGLMTLLFALKVREQNDADQSQEAKTIIDLFVVKLLSKQKQ
jgi:AcrR family transcriptional regulator